MVMAVSSLRTRDWGLRTAAEGGQIARFEYGYDREHHRLFEKRVHDGNLGDVYQYDSAYRVIRNPQNVNLAGVPAGTEILPETFASPDELAYDYDGVQNRDTHTKTTAGTPVVTAYTLQAGPPPRDAEVNQYTQTQEGANPAVGYLYDENGNLKSDGSKDFFYDFKNRLVEVRNTVGGALVAQYSHDVANRRIMKVEPAQTTVFAYDGRQVVEERDGLGAITRQYIWGPGIDELLQQQRASPAATYYAHENSIGSVCALTDATGAVVERYQYDPFGNTTVTLNGNTGNRFRFHTMYSDAETGTHHTAYRTYFERLGRFGQRDPIGTWGSGLNFGNGLAFPGNNPLFWRDPLGRDGYWEDVGETLGGFVQGVGEGLKGSAEGVAGALSDPIGAAQGIGGAFQNVWGNMSLDQIKDLLGDAFQDFMNASLQEKGRLLGKMGGEALGSKGIGKAGSAAKGKLLASGKMPSGGQLPGGLPDDPCPPKKVPGRPFTGKEAPDKAYKHLEKFHGVNPNDASERLHRIKEKSGLKPTDNAVIGRTGDVYHPHTGEHLGSLTDPALGGK